MFELHWYGYNPFSPFLAFSWLWFILTIGILIYPVGRVLNRIGFSPLWAILAFIPFVNLVALWALALADWPEKKA
jgi:hypothetical protein